jgi:2-oxoglutarate/2-oxoacid ferredoxin oxidoreductase subunit alpha
VKADKKAVLTGAHFIDGDHACSEGAIAGGCRFVAGYPITPSTEIVERIALRFPLIGGMFVQMEDEIASSIAIQGAVWAGKKAMTVTSGPGFSLMMEHIGYAAITETPCVFVNVQRGGPSTGLPTLPAQADMMQARWGSHGDYEIIAIVPNSPQECFDLTIRAFNLAEEYRVPVLIMMDECVGHMTEKVVIPEADTIDLTERKFTKKPPGEFKLFETNGSMIPEMVKVGDGYRIHLTGLTHDERGYPAMSPKVHQKMLQRLVDKILLSEERIRHLEEDQVEGADAVVVSYGITSRVVLPAINKTRKEGFKVGHIRLITVWPFPDSYIRALAGKVSAFVVPELNLGQIVHEVERCAGGNAITKAVPHAGGAVHAPEDIYDAIKGVLNNA